MSRNTSFGGFICAVLAVIVGCGAFFGLRQHFSKDDSSESETSIESVMDSSESIESEESGGDNEQETVITDLNFYANPDNFTAVEVEPGERLAGNVYRFTKNLLDMDGNTSNGYEVITLVGNNHQSCQIMSTAFPNHIFGFSDYEYTYDSSNPLLVWGATYIEGGISRDNLFETKFLNLGIPYNYVIEGDVCYVDVYFAPGSTFTVGEAGEFTLNVDDLSWKNSMTRVTRLVPKTS